MKRILVAIASSALVVACEGSPADPPVDTPDAEVSPVDTSQPGAVDTSDSGADDTPADVAPPPIQVTAEDFPCLTEMEKVRRFRVANLLGDLDASLAVANSPDGGTYPPGTLLQLVPFEAMVKHRPGWAPESNDWEFFFLDTDDGTEIVERGTTDVENQFGGNCLSCHIKAEPQWDFVCETDHGCDPLPIGPELIRRFQESDSRCP